MKLPSTSTRAGFKFEDAAQRLVWAIHNYMANANRSPANKGSIGGATTSSTKKEGMNFDEYPWFYWWYGGSFDDTIEHMVTFNITIPYDASRYSRGYSLRDCLIEFSPEEVEPLAPSIVPAGGNPIPDNSTATTLEQYIYDHYHLCYQDRIANPVTLPVNQSLTSMSAYRYRPSWSDLGLNSGPGSVEEQVMLQPGLNLQGNILRKPGSQLVLDLAGDVESQFSPYNFCSFANYNILANP